MKPLIIDTDPGHDDALAIMLAVKSGLFEIKALTTVAGNSTIENTTRNARHILQILGREDIPVYSGAEKPLERELKRAVVHGESGLAGINPTNEPNLTNNAPEKIIEIINNSKEKITLVALGPLTNVAKAIQINPNTMKKLEQIVIMGGAIRVPGNKSKVAEFNIFVDPEAADIVFKFPIKKTLVPLDACNHVQMQLEDFEKITNPALRKPILSMMKEFIEGIYKDEGIRAALVYDALTIYYLINPKACKTENLNIKIETKSETEYGRTIADLKSKQNKQEKVCVVANIDKDSFIKDFITTLNGENKSQ